MSLRLVLNPVSGQFDYIDVADLSDFAQQIPRVIHDGENWTIGEDKQGNFIGEITIEAGGEIVIRAGGLLVQGVPA